METIIWISGAIDGLGMGLAATVPYAGARVINMSRRDHPTLETVKFDLTDPASYAAVEESFRKELTGFKGRAIFIHNGFYSGPGNFGFVSEIDQQDYWKCIQANCVAPQVLGDMFLRHCGDAAESGLVLMSSAAARHPFVGSAGYNAAKAAVEMWIRTVKRELVIRERNTWVTAVRPGFVLSNSTRYGATLSGDIYPTGPQMAKQMETGEGLLQPEDAGRDIWAGLPPKNNESVLLFGEIVLAK